MLYQLSYTRVFSGDAGQRGRGEVCSEAVMMSRITAIARSYFPASPLPIFPASMVGVGFEPT
jgi:hypothetical protein